MLIPRTNDRSDGLLYREWSSRAGEYHGHHAFVMLVGIVGSSRWTWDVWLGHHVPVGVIVDARTTGETSGEDATRRAAFAALRALIAAADAA